MGQFKNATILITGAASGIGRELARQFLIEEHAKLILVDQDLDALNVLRNELGTVGEVQIHKCDVANEKDVAALFDKLTTPTINVLINCAGITQVGLFETADMNAFQKVIDVNLMGAVRITKLGLPLLLAAKNPWIVNVASLAGLIGAPGMSSYTASKFGLVGFSDALRLELEGRVSVLVVCSSFVKTDIGKNAVGTRSNMQIDKILSKMGGSPLKVAKKIVRAIQKNETLLVINPDAQLVFGLKRYFPALCNRIVKMGFERVKKSGVL